MFLEKLLFDSSVLGLKEHDDKPGDKTSSSERNIYVVNKQKLSI